MQKSIAKFSVSSLKEIPKGEFTNALKYCETLLENDYLYDII